MHTKRRTHSGKMDAAIQSAFPSGSLVQCLHVSFLSVFHRPVPADLARTGPLAERTSAKTGQRSGNEGELLRTAAHSQAQTCGAHIDKHAAGRHRRGLPQGGTCSIRFPCAEELIYGRLRHELFGARREGCTHNSAHLCTDDN